MRASYMMAKIDPGVIAGIDTRTQDEATAKRRAVLLEPFKWKHCYRNTWCMTIRRRKGISRHK
jgi:hypothetical protein